jgi:soluble lytic murein transglycosylase-like protein
MNFQRYGLALATCTIFILINTVFSNPISKEEMVKSAFISSIIQVESKGKDNAKSRDGAAGPMQIKPVLVKDINRILSHRGDSMRFSLKDRFNRDKSIQMFWIYQSFYGDDDDSFETMARRWNGGPMGHTKKSTRKYWKKVNMHFNSRMQIIEKMPNSSNQGTI